LPVDAPIAAPLIETMRLFLLLALVACLATGCASRKQDQSDQDRFQPKAARGQKRPATRPEEQRGTNRTTTEKPPVTVIQSPGGTVASVNRALRFVVLDFSIHSLPPVDQRLNLYREGRKVGEVKVTGPARDTTIAADILTGEATIGDEAREE
jgi:Ni/Co efflux regulator RcnB